MLTIGTNEAIAPCHGNDVEGILRWVAKGVGPLFIKQLAKDMNYDVPAPPNRSYVVYQRSTSDVVYKYNSYMMYVYNRCILRESERARERMCDICDICDVCDTCDICDICAYHPYK